MPQVNDTPVPAWDHYQILKDIETRIKEKLGYLEHDEFIIGLRIRYGEPPADDSIPDLIYKMEFGYLELLDGIIECGNEQEISDEEWEVIQSQNRFIITIPELDGLYDIAKESLENITQPPLCIGLDMAFYGSAIKVMSVSCTCTNLKKKYCVTNSRTKKLECYCTTTGC